MAGLNVPLPKAPTVLQPGERENQLVQGYEQESRAIDAAIAPIQRERAELVRDMAQVEMPKPPQLQEVPEYRARQLDGGEMMSFATIATALAALGAKAVRGDVTTALTAAGSAIKGFSEGNIAQTKLDIENFNTKMRSVVAQNNKMLAEYDRVLRDRKLTLAEKMQRYNILAHQFEDAIAMSALKKGDIRFELERLDKIRAANNQIELMAARMQATFAGQLARLEAAMDMQQRRLDSTNPNAGHTQYTPEALNLIASAALKDKGALTNVGKGVQGGRDLAAIWNRMAELLAQQPGSPDLAAQRAEYRANANSLNKMVMQYDAITAFEKNALANGKVLVDLAQKIDATGVPVLERWIRAGRRSLAGDPDVSAFNTQMLTFRAETARILTNPNLSGALTVHAQQEAENLVNGSDSYDQINTVVTLLEQDFKRREVALVDQMNAARDRMIRSAGAGAPPGGAAPKKGDRDKSRSGRDIEFDGTQWVYVGQ